MDALRCRSPTTMPTLAAITTVSTSNNHRGTRMCGVYPGVASRRRMASAAAASYPWTPQQG